MATKLRSHELCLGGAQRDAAYSTWLTSVQFFPDSVTIHRKCGAVRILDLRAAPEIMSGMGITIRKQG